MKSTHIYIGLVVLLIAGLVVLRNTTDSSRAVTSTEFDGFAQCLADAGAKFYGAYWCPHCQSQKKLFGNSKNLPYVECSTPDGNAQTRECTELGITSYPTWFFADGSKLDGEQTLEGLAEKTNCELPTQS